jgi:hypothetical protein
MNNDPQDSRTDTLAHIERVRQLLENCIARLTVRGAAHDASKLMEPEKSAFDRLKALSLSGMAYGSEEYRACLRAEKPAIEHHYKANSHHPEFYPQVETTTTGVMLRGAADEMEATAKAAIGSAGQGEINALLDFATFNRKTADQLESSVNGMSLFDVLEMLMDWKAATERMKDGGDIHASLVHNIERFKLSPQLAAILKNTIREMGWPKGNA